MSARPFLSRALLVCAALFAFALPAYADPSTFTVVLLRHGVRSPTKATVPPMFADWQPTPPGALTAHGSRLMQLEGRWFATTLEGGDARACADAPFLYADIDQRTLESARAFAEGWCSRDAIAVLHHALGEPDPLFSVLERAGDAQAQPANADDAQRLDRLIRARCPHCNVRPPVSLKSRSTEGENLFLEYAQCRPLDLFDPTGDGAHAVDDVAAGLRLHVQQYETANRLHDHSVAAGATILAHIVGLLQSHAGLRTMVETPDTTRQHVAVLIGHDTQLGALGGLLALHWRLSEGLPPDDMPPGSGLRFDLEGSGADASVHVRYISMTLAQFRSEHLRSDGIVVADLGVVPLAKLAAVAHDDASSVVSAWNAFDGAPWTFAPPVDPPWTACAR